MQGAVAMTTTVYAMFDGEVLRLDEPVPLAPNTRVRVTIETEQPEQPPVSFLRAARSLNVDGPPDWSSRLDDYLYGEASERDA
jgi:hypothetical protein